MADAPVVTSYPHDRLSRLAVAMTDALDKIPGTADVRAVVMLGDGVDGCVHPHNYPEPESARNALMFVDTALHLAAMGDALGVKVEVTVNGKKVPRSGVPRG